MDEHQWAMAFNSSAELFVKGSESTELFSMGGTPLTAADVIEFDQQGLLRWVNPQWRELVYRVAGDTGTSVAANLDVGLAHPAARQPDRPELTPSPVAADTVVAHPSPMPARIASPTASVSTVEASWKAPVNLVTSLLVKVAAVGMAVLWFLWLMAKVGWFFAILIAVPSLSVLPLVPFAMWFFDHTPNALAFAVWAGGMVCYASSRLTRSQHEKDMEGLRRAVGL